jgi:hypothetical protein
MDIQQAIDRAAKLESKIPSHYISTLDGLSSPKIWHLLNNLCAQADSYLEVGSYLGSTLKAALYENNVKAHAIDNFCMKARLRNHFFRNVKGLNFNFIEQDCFKVDPNNIKPIELYFFDGEHSYQSQYKAISHFLPAMKEEFVYVCDDWSQVDVRSGTMKAIEDSKLEVVESHQRGINDHKNKAEWWCGVAIFKLRKNENTN